MGVCQLIDDVSVINALEIYGLRKIYDNGVEALKGIDLTVKTGDFFALLGVNGAGKSTTIGAITTLITKTSGTININGYNLDKQTAAAKCCLGLVPQEMNLGIFETCEQILLNQAGYYGMRRRDARARAEQLLQELGLWEKRHTIVRHLSGGMKRRLMIARALIHNPQVLLLDEPTAGVDVEIRRLVWNFLIRANLQGITIILTTHYLEEAESLCKNIAIIHQGLLIENTSMHALLQALRYQTFIFNTVDPIVTFPEGLPFHGKYIDNHTFELRIDRDDSLNDVFAALSAQGICIHSLRNKTNRLEELFMDRVHNGH